MGLFFPGPFCFDQLRQAAFFIRPKRLLPVAVGFEAASEECDKAGYAEVVSARRLSCPAVAFLFILDRYAEARGWNIDDTLLQGTFFRLAFGRRKELRKRFRRRKR